MERHPNNLTTDEDIDAALARAEEFDRYPRIADVTFRPEQELEFLVIRLTDGRRIALRREDVSEVRGATTEQILDFELDQHHGLHIWWTQLDDGIYLPNLLRDLAEQVAA